jgi:hypothetical protein
MDEMREMDCIDVAKDKDRWREIENMVMNCQVL